MRAARPFVIRLVPASALLPFPLILIGVLLLWSGSLPGVGIACVLAGCFLYQLLSLFKTRAWLQAEAECRLLLSALNELRPHSTNNKPVDAGFMRAGDRDHES